MKAKKINLCGQDYYLCMNATAMFELDELRGENDIVDITQANDKASIEILFKAAEILSEQGELTRRKLGYDNGKILTAEDLHTIAQPIDILLLKESVYKAMSLGYGRESEDDDKEIDLVLQELEKKTGNG